MENPSLGTKIAQDAIACAARLFLKPRPGLRPDPIQDMVVADVSEEFSQRVGFLRGFRAQSMVDMEQDQSPAPGVDPSLE
jgi:hypothetical protein